MCKDRKKHAELEKKIKTKNTMPWLIARCPPTQSVVKGAPLVMSWRTSSVSPFFADSKSCLPRSTKEREGWGTSCIGNDICTVCHNEQSFKKTYECSFSKENALVKGSLNYIALYSALFYPISIFITMTLKNSVAPLMQPAYFISHLSPSRVHLLENITSHFVACSLLCNALIMVR